MDDLTPASATQQATAADEPSAVAAVRQLYELHYVRLVRLAVLLLGDLGRAEEIVQDAFVDLMARWSRLRDRAAAASYLRTSVANGARSDLRRRQVIRRHPPDRPPDVDSAEARALVQVEHERIMAVLSVLPHRQREVLVLRYYGELSEAEIAETLGISRGAVKSHSSRGLRTLRTAMEVTR